MTAHSHVTAISAVVAMLCLYIPRGAGRIQLAEKFVATDASAAWASGVRAAMQACEGGGHLTHFRMDPYCACGLHPATTRRRTLTTSTSTSSSNEDENGSSSSSLEIMATPYCRGSSCYLTYGIRDTLSSVGVRLVELAPNPQVGFDRSLQSNENMTLFDGYPPACRDCMCYRNLDETHTLHWQQSLRRYRVLHSQMTTGFQPLRFLAFTIKPNVGGGWADRLRGILGIFWAAMLHDYAFFIDYKHPSPLEDHYEPSNINWAFDILNIEKTRTVLAMMPNSCESQLELYTSAVEDGQNRAFITNHLPTPCMFRWQKPTDEIYQAYRGRNDDKYGHSIKGEINLNPETDRLAKLRGFDNITSPAAVAFRFLFHPNNNLLRLFEDILHSAGLMDDQPYLGIHLRTGFAVAGDSGRLSEKMILPCLKCVLSTEVEMGLDPEIPWFIASDYNQTANFARQFLLENDRPSTKVVDISTIGGIISHVAKTGAGHIGDQFAYLDFLMLRKAAILFGNDSGFNRMAAAVGDHERRIILTSCSELPVPY